jgi:hypothetical protein
MASAIVQSENGRALEFPLLIDSGADMCLFPLKVARSFGLDMEGMLRSVTGGVGSTGVPTYHATVTIYLQHRIAFKALVGFSEGMDRAGFGLHGQQGFFESYGLQFRHRAKVFVIEPS